MALMSEDRDTVRDVLIKAAERVSEEGKWCQKTYFLDIVGINNPRQAIERDAPACALGALTIAEYQLTGESNILPLFSFNVLAAIREIEDILKEQTNSEFLGSVEIVSWNDAKGRTADEVAEVFRRAADKL